jgi:hypothetical protein
MATAILLLRGFCACSAAAGAASWESELSMAISCARDGFATIANLRLDLYVSLVSSVI